VNPARLDPNLAAASDDRESDREFSDEEQLSMFARAGQLALPGAVAQLGLDGVAYAPATSDRSPERASHSLGTHTGFCKSADSLANSAKPTPAENAPGDIFQSPKQLALDLDAWEEAPQLSMFGRLAVQRDVLAYSEWDRYSKCGWVRYKASADVPIARRESGTWSPGSVVRCGYPGCPWCGTQLAQTRAAELGACIEAHRNNAEGDTDVWMLSPTIPHYATDCASVVVEQLYAAQAMLVRSRTWRTFSKKWGLLGNGVRCLDSVIGGGNGLHAHFHIALFPTRAGLPTTDAWRLDLDDKATKVDGWTIANGSTERFWASSIASYLADDDGPPEDVRALPSVLSTQLRTFGVWRKLRHCSQRVREKYLAEVSAPLLDEWERCCLAVGVRIENREAFRRTALRLTPGEDAAAYFVGWMLADEVTRSTMKDRSPLRLLDAIKAGIKGAAFTYKQFRRAVDGRQWISGLGDLKKRLGVTDEMVKAYADERRRRREAELAKEGTPVSKKRELSLVVRAHLFQAVHRLGWDAVFSFIDEAETKLAGDDAALQSELDGFLWQNLAVASESQSDSIATHEQLTG
jgi:hypothetical protein